MTIAEEFFSKAPQYRTKTALQVEEKILLQSVALDILAYIASDEFYDLLPGNGKDDYICQKLKEKVIEVCKRPR